MADMQIDSPPQEIDESLYSRQLYVLGKEAMLKMQNANVLIIGLKGLGIEIAKNIALAGVKSLAIYDQSTVEIADLSSQFFLSESDVGKLITEVSRSKLAELNSYVPISIVNDLSHETLSGFKCIVSTNISLEQQVEINNYTHSNNIGYIHADSRGLFGQIFVDFGSDFLLIDKNGEEVSTGIVSDINLDGTITTLDSRHGLEDGDYIKFSEVDGMPKLTSGEAFKISVLGPYAIKLENPLDESYGKYKKGGIFTQVKVPSKVTFEPLIKQLSNPEYVISDFAKLDRPPQYHLGFQGLHAFKTKNGRLPRPANIEDSNQLLQLVKELATQNPTILGQDGEVDEKLIKELSFQAVGDIPGVNAFFGGIIAQEVLKNISSKYGPIKQWLYFDSLESLPSPEEYPRNEETCKPQGSRYDNQIAVYGKKFHENISNLKVFLVGAGAIGCEMLKNWAMMGLGSGPEGKITITDMDSIEKSNLNRQFLFRPKDVGKNKSEVAAKAAQVMNPELNGKVEALLDRVGTATEHIFDDAFWNGLDLVTNALDNVEARMYVDHRCVFYKLPLLESGTLGTKGNTQVIIPNLTESYSSTVDPPEKSIALCTLRSFPNNINHTIAWAKSLFQDYFADSPESVNLYLSQPNYVEKTLKQNPDIKGTLEIIANMLNQRPYSFEDCVKWARLTFETKFSHEIKQLLHVFPVDAVTSQGAPFWSGPKRAPSALSFDINNKNHFDFIVGGANLLATVYGLKETSFTFDDYENALNKVEVKPFAPKANINIAVTEEEAEAQANNLSGTIDDTEIKKIAAALPEPSTLAGYRLNLLEFEKDDDTNHHIEFIGAASNLRALNYGIEPVDASKTKFIAGKIIPAMATTTASVTGLICLELYKIVAKNNDIEQYKNGFINLALPFIGFSEPIKSQTKKYNDKEFDVIWDRIDITGNPTLQEMLDHFEQNEGLEITMISYDVSLLYTYFTPPKKANARKKMRLTELVKEVTKKEIPSHVKNLVFVICADDKDGNEVPDIPYICVKI